MIFLLIVVLICIDCCCSLLHSRVLSSLAKSKEPSLIFSSSSLSQSVNRDTDDEFVAYAYQQIAQPLPSSSLPSSLLLLEIRNELFTRLPIKNINTLSKCLWLLTLINKQARHNTTIGYNDSDSSKITINISSEYLGLKDNVIIISLLNNLVDNKIGKWRDLPIDIRVLLLTKIVSVPSLKYCIIDIITCLSKLGFDYHRDSDENFKIFFMKSIKENHQNQDISKLLYTMSRLNMKWYTIDDDIQELISRAISDKVIYLKEREIVDIVYALGKMDLQWTTLSETTRLILLKEIERVVNDMRSPGLSNVLWGLGKCNAKWNTLSMRMRTKLLDQIVRLSPLDTHSTTSTIKGLGRMSVTWTSLPDSVRTAIELGIPSVKDNPNELVVSSLLWSLGRLKASDKLLKKETKSKIFDIVYQVSSTFSDQGISSAYYGFANMKFLYQKLPLNVVNSLEFSCGNKLSVMDTQAVSNIIWSLGQMNARWDEPNFDYHEIRCIGDDFRGQLIKAIDRTVEKMTEQGLSNTLFGLAKMNVQWIQLPVDTRNIIFKAILKSSDSFNQQGVSNVYWALAALGVSWDNSLTINPAVLTALCDAAIRVHDEMQCQTVATCYYSIARMDAKYNNIPNNLKEAMESAFIRSSSSMKAFEISNSIYGLGKLGANIGELSKEFQYAIISSVTSYITSMNEQELGNTLWGLGQLGIGYSMMSKTLQDNIVEAVFTNRNRMRKQALIAILHGLGKNVDVTWQQLPKHLTQTLLSSAVRVCNIQSNQAFRDIRLVGNLLQMLGKLQIDWNNKDFEISNEQVPPYASLKPFNKELLNCFNQSFANNKIEAGRALANSLSGIAMMQADWGHLDRDLISILSSVIQNSIEIVSTSEFASIMWSLGRMGADFNQFPESLQKTLYTVLSKQFFNMNPYEFAWSTWALGRMRMQYALLPTESMSAYLNAAGNVISKMEQREVGVTLWGLGRIQAPVNDFSLEMRNVLFQGIESIINAKFAAKLTIVNDDYEKNSFVHDNEDAKSKSIKNARLKAFKRLTKYLDDVGINFKQLDLDTQKKLLLEALK